MHGHKGWMQNNADGYLLDFCNSKEAGKTLQFVNS